LSSHLRGVPATQLPPLHCSAPSQAFPLSQFMHAAPCVPQAPAVLPSTQLPPGVRQPAQQRPPVAQRPLSPPGVTHALPTGAGVSSPTHLPPLQVGNQQSSRSLSGQTSQVSLSPQAVGLLGPPQKPSFVMQLAQ